MVSSHQAHTRREKPAHSTAIMLMLRGHEVGARPLASLQQPACPLSDSLTFNTAVTHRFTYNGGERERERPREGRGGGWRRWLWGCRGGGGGGSGFAAAGLME